MLGVTTAVTGGMIRDVICNEIPLILSREIYATAAFAASLAYVLADRLALGDNAALDDRRSRRARRPRPGDRLQLVAAFFRSRP